MQELLKLQAEMTKKNTTSLDINTHAANDLKMDVKKLSELNVKAANDEEYKKKREEEVSDSLKKLNATLQIAIKNGLGAATGKKLAENTALRADVAGKSSGLRQFLLGGKSDEEVQSKSITGFTGFVSNQLKKRENKQALKEEKKQFVEDAMKNDPTIYARKANFAGGMKTPEGRAIAKEEAEKRFDTIKEKEAAVSKAHEKITAAEQAGYAPLKKDLKARDDATKELGLVDTRMKPMAEAHTVGEEEKSGKAKFQADEIKAESEQSIVQHEMGKTLITSLDIQKQQLAALTKLVETGGAGGGSAGGGSSAVDTALDIADAASNFGGKGKMLGKAGKFLSKAGPGLLKGGLLSTGGELVEMGGDALTEAGHEKIGGAVSTLGTAGKYAGYGAMIGSVVPGLGTAVGAGVGGVIGAGVGLYNNWDNMFGKKKEDEAKTTSAEMESVMGRPVEKGKPLDPDQMTQVKTNMEHGIKPSALVKESYDLALKQPKVEGVGNGSSNISSASASNEELKTGAGKANTNVVNAPTTINNNNSGGKTDIRAPLRNQESSVNNYIQNRYA